jgi:DNA-binding response OmpR family regulator
MLPQNGDWQVVGEAADGLEAIEAMALAPDLILLDVELPGLNGIETARRILALDPNARILFVTAHRSWDIAAAALGTGARGYILKPRAGRELLPAMKAIAEGRRFVSAVLAGRVVEPMAREHVAKGSRFHEAWSYSEDTSLLDDVARFAAGSLVAGKAFMILASESRRNAVRQRLQAHGLHIDLAVKQGRYLSFDVAHVPSSCMVDGWPDEARFWNATTALIMRAAQASRGDYPGVALYGEGCASLFRDGQGDATIRLEHLCDELARTFNVEMVCGYPGVAPDHDDEDVFQRICSEHSVVHTR